MNKVNLNFQRAIQFSWRVGRVRVYLEFSIFSKFFWKASHFAKAFLDGTPPAPGRAQEFNGNGT